MMKTDQRGSTLLLVTWLLAIMGIVATFLIYRSESEWAAVLNAEERIREQRLAEETLNEQLAVLLSDDNEQDTPADTWFNKTGRFQLEKDGYRITVIVEDEGSKPNLNLMSEDALRVLLPKDEKISIDPLLDWIDSDHEIREAGAEEPYYQELSPKYKPRDGFCASLQDILAVKDGKKLYKYFAPELTVYGRINLNALNTEQFKYFLVEAGLHPTQLDSIGPEFQTYLASKNRFTYLKDVEKLAGVALGTADKLKPIFDIPNDDEKFIGACNINFVSEKGLKVIIKNAGITPKTVMIKQILIRRNEEAFTDIETLSPLLGINSDENESEQTVQVGDFFSTTSSYFRYHIWVVKGDQKYYLNTVHKRIAGDLRTKWKIQTLSWQVLTGKKVPEIPKKTLFEATLKSDDAEPVEKAEEYEEDEPAALKPGGKEPVDDDPPDDDGDDEDGNRDGNKDEDGNRDGDGETDLPLKKNSDGTPTEAGLE